MQVNIESAINDLETVRDFLRWTTSRLNEAGVFLGHGTDDAWDESVALVLHVLHLPWDVDNRIMDSRLTLEEKRQVTDLVKQRVEQRVPLAYLTNTAWFAGLPFYVDSRVLIPRSPFAELIEKGFQPWVDVDSVHRALDLCTGGGCIGIAMALSLPHAQIDAIDLSSSALEVAQQNVDNHGVDDIVSLIKSDCFDALGAGQSQYDLIVSNPPYVGGEEMASLPAEYLKEPRLALASGDDGLDIVRRILSQAVDYLTDSGTLICEVGNSDQALEAAFPRVPFTWIDFEHGGHGVFIFTAKELQQYRQEFI